MGKWRESVLGFLVSMGAAVSPGCQQESNAPSTVVTPFPGISLKVGALDDPALLVGVTSQRGEWVASRGGDVSIRQEPVPLESLSDVDVPVFPGQRLGDL